MRANLNHSCKCKAEFCYICGIKWKGCHCDDWEEDLLDLRAQQVVDREVLWPVAPAVRRQRVADMTEELLATHECNHPGKFARLPASRRGMVCEICGVRHRKFILSCRRCHMLACNDCRCTDCRPVDLSPSGGQRNRDGDVYLGWISPIETIVLKHLCLYGSAFASNEMRMWYYNLLRAALYAAMMDL